jgi:hypothetical protein
MKMKDQVIHWLLENENPPVRYLTLTKLLKKSETASDVQQAKARLMEYKVTKGILRHSKEFWRDDDRAYWKYTGKYWQLIFLGQFMADGKEPRIAEGVHDILNKRKWVIKSGGQCLTANLLAALMRLGYSDHPVVIEETESLANRVLADGGIRCSVMDYSLMSRCYMALPKLLLCFGEVPEWKRSPAVIGAMKLISETLLANEIHIYVPGNRKEWQRILEQQPKRVDLPKGQTAKDWISDRDFRSEEEIPDFTGNGHARTEARLAQVRLPAALQFRYFGGHVCAGDRGNDYDSRSSKAVAGD